MKENLTSSEGGEGSREESPFEALVNTGLFTEIGGLSGAGKEALSLVPDSQRHELRSACVYGELENIQAAGLTAYYKTSAVVREVEFSYPRSAFARDVGHRTKKYKISKDELTICRDGRLQYLQGEISRELALERDKYPKYNTRRVGFSAIAGAAIAGGMHYAASGNDAALPAALVGGTATFLGGLGLSQKPEVKAAKRAIRDAVDLVEQVYRYPEEVLHVYNNHRLPDWISNDEAERFRWDTDSWWGVAGRDYRSIDEAGGDDQVNLTHSDYLRLCIRADKFWPDVNLALESIGLHLDDNETVASFLYSILDGKTYYTPDDIGESVYELIVARETALHRLDAVDAANSAKALAIQHGIGIDHLRNGFASNAYLSYEKVDEAYKESWLDFVEKLRPFHDAYESRQQIIHEQKQAQDTKESWEQLLQQLTVTDYVEAGQLHVLDMYSELFSACAGVEQTNDNLQLAIRAKALIDDTPSMLGVLTIEQVYRDLYAQYGCALGMPDFETFWRNRRAL